MRGEKIEGRGEIIENYFFSLFNFDRSRLIEEI